MIIELIKFGKKKTTLTYNEAIAKHYLAFT